MDFVWSSGQREAKLFVIQMGHTQKVTQAIQWSEKMRKTDRQDQVIWGHSGEYGNKRHLGT